MQCTANSKIKIPPKDTISLYSQLSEANLWGWVSPKIKRNQVWGASPFLPSQAWLLLVNGHFGLCSPVTLRSQGGTHNS